MNNCPHCNSSWIGEAIPKKQQKHYGATHFKREIGIDGGFIGVYDGTVALLCPDCNKHSPRNNTKWALEMYNKFMETTK